MNKGSADKIWIISFIMILIFLFVANSNAQEKPSSTFLPQPTGIYQIGTTELFIVDSSRKERFKKKNFRKLYIKIWYPALPSRNDETSLYIQDYSSELIYDIFKSKDFSVALLNEIKKNTTNSYPNAALDTSKSKYPMIIFTPGYYFGIADLYTAYMEELASHGYIICSVNHPYEQPYIQFPEGEEIYLKKKRTQWAYLQLVIANWFQFRNKDSHENIVRITRYYHKMLRRFHKALDYWVADTRFFLDYLEENYHHENAVISAIDMDRVGGLGQSFGGAVIGELCLLDERMKSGVNLDCFQFGEVIDQPLQQPFMLIQSDYQPTWNLGNTINFENTDGDFLLLHLYNASHFVFSDGAVLPYKSEDFKNRMIGDIQGEKLLAITNEYMVDFFDHFLKNEEPEIIFENKSDSIFQYHFRRGN